MKNLMVTLKEGKSERTPIWFMRQAGRHLPEYMDIREKAKDFMDFCFNPEMASVATLQPVERYDIDAAILFSDILVTPYALGQDVKFVKGEGPKLSKLNIDELTMGDFSNKLSPIMETIKKVKANIKEDKTFIGFCGSPWTVATYMVQGKGEKNNETTRKYALQEVENFQRLLDILVNANIEYLSMQVEAGVEVLQIFDSWSGVLDELSFAKYVIEPTKKIVAGVKAKHPNIPIIGFPKGSGAFIEEFVAETKVDAVSIDNTTSMKKAKKLQEQVVVQGNLDNYRMLYNKDQLKEAVNHILDNLAGGNFIFNLSHGFLPQTPIENVNYVIDLIRKRDV